MNARQRRRRARRPYQAIPATQERVDAEYRLLMNAQRELLVAAADERIAQFDPALYELLGEAREPLQGPDDETPKTRRRRPRRAVKPAPAPEPEPEEVDGVFLASGHQITIQKAAAAEVMKGFRRVELLARGRAAAQRSQERREPLRTPIEALPSLAPAAPPVPAAEPDSIHARAEMLQQTIGAGIFGMVDMFKSHDDRLTAAAAIAALGEASARPQPVIHVQMPEAAPAAPPVVNIHVPDQPAPIVNIAAPEPAKQPARQVRIEFDERGQKRYVSEEID